MNKKGFTLIELLAVVVVLAIILIVAIPRVLNVVNKTSVSASVVSSKNILKHANNYYAKRLLTGLVSGTEIVIDFSDQDNLPIDFGFSGKLPLSGKILITDKESKIDGYLKYDDLYCEQNRYTKEVECKKEGLGRQLQMNYDSATGMYYIDGITTQPKANNKNVLKYDSWSTASSNKIFWDNLTNQETFKATPMEDGWVRIEWDRKADDPVGYINLFTKKGAADFKPNTDYTFFIESRNVDPTIDKRKYINVAKTHHVDKTFSTNFRVTIGEMMSSSLIKKCIRTSTIDDINADNFSLRTFTGAPAGSKGSFEVRLMILEGDYTNIDVEYELYGNRPSIEHSSVFNNEYLKGLYSTVINNKTYMFYLEDDLRETPNGVADRLWVDSSSERVFVERKVGFTKLSGNETWLFSENYSNNGSCFYISKGQFLFNVGKDIKHNSAIYSSHLPYTNLGYSSYKNRVGESIYGYPDASAAFMITTQKKLNLQDWKTWLASSDFKIHYELKETYVEEIERK